ncbi:hypothetical protein ABW21_db0203115 [Orbilia brochopaga]|nr:hypothetical protein ABW21_db0203115 [Drechslerella brochopaga]
MDPESPESGEMSVRCPATKHIIMEMDDEPTNYPRMSETRGGPLVIRRPDFLSRLKTRGHRDSVKADVRERKRKCEICRCDDYGSLVETSECGWREVQTCEHWYNCKCTRKLNDKHERERIREKQRQRQREREREHEEQRERDAYFRNRPSRYQSGDREPQDPAPYDRYWGDQFEGPVVLDEDFDPNPANTASRRRRVSVPGNPEPYYMEGRDEEPRHRRQSTGFHNPFVYGSSPKDFHPYHY